MASSRPMPLLLLPLLWGAAPCPASVVPRDDVSSLLQQAPVSAAERAFLTDWANGFNGRPKSRHRPVVFLHLHKAGGTSMCALARANGEFLMWSGDPASCNWLPYDDYKFWHPAEPRPDCGDRLVSWLSSGFTWTQMERPLLAQDHCPEQFAYATMLRQPVATALSMVNYVDPATEWRGDRYRHFMDCLEEWQRGNDTACGDENFSPTTGLMWLYFDNPVVRALGGRGVWDLPPGKVRREHADLALAVLAQFDLVLFLEDLSSQRTRERLAGLFGWSNFTQIRVNSMLEQRVRFTEEDVARIERLNAHDLYLYRTARSREDGASFGG